MNLFIQNKYTKWYFAIVNNAKFRTLECYNEIHHILPRSLGGTNEKENLVQLTAREHFICHLLLTKMFIGENHYKMAYALHCMLNMKRDYQFRFVQCNSKLYEYYKIKYSKAVSETRKAYTGWKHSEETKNKIREANRNKTIPIEQRRKISNSLKGNIPVFKGKKHSDETLKLISEKTKGKPSAFKGKKHSEDSISKNRESNLKKIYTIKSPTDETFVIKDLKSFCEKMNLPYNTLRKSFLKGHPIKDHFNLENKSAIGWHCTLILDA